MDKSQTRPDKKDLSVVTEKNFTFIRCLFCFLLSKYWYAFSPIIFI